MPSVAPATAARAEAPSSSTATTTAAAPVGATVPPGTGPVIVIDPGHSPTITSTDPATGLNDSDYENEPEMRDVFAVAQLVKAQLEAAGYRVVMTKTRADRPVSLGQRAAIANAAHAALAISIHDQAGANGGIGFNRATTSSTTSRSATTGRRRAAPRSPSPTPRSPPPARGTGRSSRPSGRRPRAHSITLQGNVGYDLGTRGLAAGNIWIVQLLSKVPWIYNEAGGNSAGLSSLSAADKQKYATGLVNSIRACVPVTG